MNRILLQSFHERPGISPDYKSASSRLTENSEDSCRALPHFHSWLRTHTHTHKAKCSVANNFLPLPLTKCYNACVVLTAVSLPGLVVENIKILMNYIFWMSCFALYSTIFSGLCKYVFILSQALSSLGLYLSVQIKSCIPPQ